MMNNQNCSTPSVFSFESTAVRTFADERNELWFLANDVCGVLGYANPRKAVADHCKEKGVTKRYTPTESGEQEMTFINEGNLYRLIVKSRKPEAERFEEWVMDEVLPTIRKTGRYETPYSVGKDDTLTKDEQDALRKIVTQHVESLPKEQQGGAAIKMWSKLKSHFGVPYRLIPRHEFAEAVSLLTRATLSQPNNAGELLRWVMTFNPATGAMSLDQFGKDTFEHLMRDKRAIPDESLPVVIGAAVGRALLANWQPDKAA